MSQPAPGAPAPAETNPASRGGEFVATIVGTDKNIDTFAREAANNQLHEKIHSTESRLPRLSRIGKKIWHGNIARDYYLEKYTRQAKENIETTGSLYANEAIADNKATRDGMRVALTERFTSEYDDKEVIREGENRRELADEGPEADLKASIKGLDRKSVV